MQRTVSGIYGFGSALMLFFGGQHGVQLPLRSGVNESGGPPWSGVNESGVPLGNMFFPLNGKILKVHLAYFLRFQAEIINFISK